MMIKFAEPSIEERKISHLQRFYLSKNYPNPFSTKTVIEFTVYGLQFTDKNREPSTVNCQLQIYDLAGRLVKSFPITQSLNNPITKVVWDGKNDLGERVGSGLYFYKLKVGDKFSQTKKLLLLR